MTYRIGIDIGGTCTDCVVLTGDGRLILAKALSTPLDFSDGIANALEEASLQVGVPRALMLKETPLLVHSTTIAENAMVNGTVARVGMVATQGFGSTLWATRGGYGRWSGISDDEKRDPVRSRKPSPIVPLALTREVRERVAVGGGVVIQPNRAEVEAVALDLQRAGVTAVAVALLWSCLDPRNEHLIGVTLRRTLPGVFVALSSEVAGVMGEYERASTAAISAAIGPTVQSYLTLLRSRLRALGFRGQLMVMQSYGGVTEPRYAAKRPAGMIESGPVGGLIGCVQLGGLLGRPNILAADMGGTTFKLGAIRVGEIEYQRESTVLGYHMSVPKLDIASFGLAGGSVISIDPSSGRPRVGPRSAGSQPGPVCYDMGGVEPTVTDVDAILGYLNPRYFLGGHGNLVIDRARSVFDASIAAPLKMDASSAAASIYRLVNSLIYDFVHKATVEKGLDPRRFALFSTGGTAGMHLPAVADKIGVPVTIVPHSASVQGAFGAVTANLVTEELVTFPLRYPASTSRVRQILRRATIKAVRSLRGQAPHDELMVRWTIDMRFHRQVHLISVPLFEGCLDPSPMLTTADLDMAVAQFEGMYRERYGAESAYREAGVEFVMFRARVWHPSRFRYEPEALVAATAPSESQVAEPLAYVPDMDHFAKVAAYDFELLLPGHTLKGPAIVWSPITTIVIGASQGAAVDGYRNLVISRRV